MIILGLTALDLADKADHTECMAVLREAVDRQVQEKHRHFYHLLDACAAGDLNTVKSILTPDNNSSDLVNFVPNGSSSLLFKASEHGQKEVVKFLIERGAAAVIHPVTKYSPLYIAAYNGKKDIVEILLKKFPELINVQTVEKWLPLHAACFNAHSGVLEFLLKYKYPQVRAQCHTWLRVIKCSTYRMFCWSSKTGPATGSTASPWTSTRGTSPASPSCTWPAVSGTSGWWTSCWSTK